MKIRFRSLFVFAFVTILAGACAEPAPPAPAEPAVKSAEARTQWYLDCWKLFNSQQYDQFQNCYSETATSESVDSAQPMVTGRAAIVEQARTAAASFPDRRGEVRLVLANGSDLASVALYTGTNSGPLPPGPDGKAVPATNKTIGLLVGHVIELDPTGSVAVRDAVYVEEGTMMAQLGLNPAPARPAETPAGTSPVIVMAANDEAEQANLASARRVFEAANAHDVAAVGALSTDDYRLIEVGMPADMNKQQSLDGMKEMIGAFPDMSITPVKMWAAGSYVVIEGRFTGTNKGDMPSMGLKATGKPVSARFLEIMKFDGGKLLEDWLFYNGAAFQAQLTAK